MLLIHLTFTITIYKYYYYYFLITEKELRNWLREVNLFNITQLISGRLRILSVFPNVTITLHKEAGKMTKMPCKEGIRH